MLIVCSDCNEEIKGTKVILSTTIHGKCIICGEQEGRKLIYSEINRTKNTGKARNIVLNMKNMAEHLTKRDEDGEVYSLYDVPEEKLKPNVKKALHLRKGPKNVECIYALETRKGIEFVHGYHHDEFCPAIHVPSKLKRRS